MAKADFLLKRAKEFLIEAQEDIKKGFFNLAAFHLEQACQLYLKYYLFLKLADFPKTHDLDELLEGIGEIYKRKKAIEKIKKENLHLIADLNQAYITSRYLPVEFNKKQVEEMRNFVKNLISFLKNL